MSIPRQELAGQTIETVCCIFFAVRLSVVGQVVVANKTI